MSRGFIIWLCVSIALCIAGKCSPYLSLGTGTELFLLGWVSLSLAIGYRSSPSHPLYGKIIFGFICVMIAGIAFKIFHLFAPDLIILIGLIGIMAGYGAMWIEPKKD